jgi:hypothetical protein
LFEKNVTPLAITPQFLILSLCPNHSKAVVICNQGAPCFELGPLERAKAKFGRKSATKI